MRYDIGDRVRMTLLGHVHSGSILEVRRGNGKLMEGVYYTVVFDKGGDWRTARAKDLELESPLESLALCGDS